MLLDIHIDRLHQEIGGKINHICPHCGDGFIYKYSLTFHIEKQCKDVERKKYIKSKRIPYNIGTFWIYLILNHDLFKFGEKLYSFDEINLGKIEKRLQGFKLLAWQAYLILFKVTA